MTIDPKDFGAVPARAKKAPALPDPLPTDKNGLIALVAAKGGFPPRATRWMAAREVHALLRDDFPIESSCILAVPDPREIKSADDFLTLAADRRVAYNARLKANAEAKAKAQAKAQEPDATKPS